MKRLKSSSEKDLLKTFSVFAILVVVPFILISKSFANHPPVIPISSIDLQRYLGRWFEIASFPQRFSRNCVATTADYSLMDNGNIRVVNRCRRGSLDGPQSEIKGRAWVSDPRTDAILAVQFFWPFVGDYWIIGLGPDRGNGYEWALVGSPDRESLWILNRSPQMSSELYSRIIEQARVQGFDVNRLKQTQQP